MNKNAQIAIQNKNQKYLYIFMGLSILLHGLFLISKTADVNWASLSEKEEQKFIIKLRPQTIKAITAKQIVQTEQANKLKKTVNKVFLGKKDNFVARQTKSRTVGKFKKAGMGTKSQELIDKARVSRNSKIQKKFKDLKFTDLGMMVNPKKDAKVQKHQEANSVAKGLANGVKNLKGLGQSNDFMEDIPLGDFTKLNTQEYEFYGFYHRIRQKLEQFWGQNIQEQADKIFKSGRSIASEENHITSLEIDIDQRGQIVRVNVNGTSGVKELDDAAVQTFNQAGPFPNPPKGMVRNGQATIKWSFVVNT